MPAHLTHLTHFTRLAQSRSGQTPAAAGDARATGNALGIYSICSAHPLVIEAAMHQALDDFAVAPLASLDQRAVVLCGADGVGKTATLIDGSAASAPPAVASTGGGARLGPPALPCASTPTTPTTLQLGGLTCEHCVARVQKALEAVAIDKQQGAQQGQASAEPPAPAPADGKADTRPAWMKKMGYEAEPGTADPAATAPAEVPPAAPLAAAAAAPPPAATESPAAAP